ncbi:MAG: Uma2 family endonuclease [Alphaproteobacteria bacterium]|nr:Uma2 family endonuclease [Alphaproteobacteria bacterium]
MLRRSYTATDLARFDEDARAQLIDGVLVFEESRPVVLGAVQAALAYGLAGPYHLGLNGPGGWWIFTETDIILASDQAYRPDLCGVLRERMPVFQDRPQLDLRPDWVCEILSPTSVKHDLVAKRRGYHRAAVPWYWLADPANATLTALRWEPAGYVLHAVATLLETAYLPPFEAAALPMQAIFPVPAGRTPQDFIQEE